jgi:hypothetical protein
LIRRRAAGIVPPNGAGDAMWVAAAWAVAACLLMAGCGDKDQDTATTTGHTGCPIPVHYDKATLDKVQAALDKLPPDSVLRQTMSDYEQERDDLRFCR